MPYVNIEIIRDGATRGQKTALIRGVTDLLVTSLARIPGRPSSSLMKSKPTIGGPAETRSPPVAVSMQPLRSQQEGHHHEARAGR